MRQTETYEQSREAAAWIRQRVPDFSATIGIVLGTGLGNLTEEIVVTDRFAYAEVPHFPVSTVIGHSGELVIGQLGDTVVIALSGRFHYYEGYSMQEVTFPIRVLQALGVETVVMSNASGGMNPEYRPGDLVIIQDHISLHGAHPLRGPNDERLGPRFPDMLGAYDPELIALGMSIAEDEGYRCHLGVYAGLQGPSLETGAEYRMLRILGADVVGMSTIPEVLVARHMNLRVFVISVCANMGYPPEARVATTAEDVVAAGQEAEPRLTKVIRELIGRMPPV